MSHVTSAGPVLRPLSALLLFAGLCLGQSVTGGGTIQGTVKDASGAVIAHAKVSCTHIDTGEAISSETNSDGFFTTPPVRIGKYKVRVQAPGMKAWEGDLILETGRTAEIEPVLTAGQVSETVTVSETIPLVTTTDPTDGTTLDSRRIQELPVNGRDMNTLLSDVTPGVEQVIDVNGGVRTSGMMVDSTNYVQDAATPNNREVRGAVNLAGLGSAGQARAEASTSNAKDSSPPAQDLTTTAVR